MRGKLQVAIVAAFVVLDVLLVVLAVRHAQEPDASAASVTVPTTEPTTPATIQPSGSPPPQLPADGPVLLDASPDGSTVLRVAPGSCADGKPPIAELGEGGDFAATATDLDVGEVVRLDVADTGALAFLATDADCQVVPYRSADGQTWTQATAQPSGWYVDPADPEAVRSPAGSVIPGCPVLDVDAVDTSTARVLCEDGQLLGTANTGQEWSVLGSLDGAVAMSFLNPTDVVALAETSDCPASVQTSTNGGSAWEELDCLDGSTPRGLGGTDALVAQVDDTVYLSTDGGQSWSPA